jgi:DNA-binding response OmpR family regulator
MSFSIAAPTSAARILVVDDDEHVRSSLSCALEDHGYDVDVAGDGPSAFKLLERRPPDLVLLDIVMPTISGLDVLAAIRSTTRRLPVILVSALCSEENRIRGLRLGADDYIVKPFATRELMARVDAVLRRANGGTDPLDIVESGGLKLDPLSREVWVDGEPVALTAREFDLLLFLAARPGRVFTRDALLRHVWSSSASWQTPATVTEHVHRLRIKIGARSDDGGERITTVRGVGYRFERRHASG